MIDVIPNVTISMEVLSKAVYTIVQLFLVTYFHLTEGLVALLVVATVPEGTAAVGAAEALRVEVLVERRDALVED